MSTLDVVSFGCRLNTYEAEAMRAKAESSGLKDAVIFNTCAVTAEAMRQARQAIRRARAERPNARLIVAGCAAQIAPDMFARMPEVDRVLGNAEKLEPANYGFGLGAEEKVRVNSIAEVRETASHMVDGFAAHARAFVQIQNGCDHRCTFCIIPFARGPSRSVPMGAVVSEIAHLVARGYREAVLTGVDITAYGADLPGRPTLGGLVRRILRALPELDRLRLSSIDCIEADEDIFRAFAEEPRLMPHVHLSLQSGDPMILKRMKRRHTPADALAFCRKLHRLRSDIAIGADVIAGFPTETDEMFENTLRHVEDLGVTFLHVFPFSPRPGTPAARMPELGGHLIAERAARLRSFGASTLKRYLAGEIGKTRSVLAERGGRGHTECFAPVRFVHEVEPRSLVSARITAAAADHLVARSLP